MANEINAVAGQLWGVPVGQVYTAGKGVVIDNVHKTVRVDETVLWEDANGKTPSNTGDFPITISEAISNFERVRFYWQTFNSNDKNHTISEKMTDINTITLEGFIYNPSNDNGFSILWALSVSGTSLSHVACKYNNWSNNTVSGAGNFVRLYKIVGVNRISS